MPKAKRREITNEDGKRVGTILEITEYEKIPTDVEELEQIRAYDRAKTETDEAIPFEEAFDEIERTRE